MKIYVFGNPLVKKDSLAVKLSKKLKKVFPQIDFVEFDVVEDLKEENLVIMDVAEGIEKVEIIEDLDLLENRKIYSLHDYDLSYELKLLKKIGKIKNVKIIAIPFNLNEEEALKQVINYIHLIFKK
ncbi:MAG: hypothetical protein QXW01_01600 [Candidatus Aenigmatarchaeota archaeon]